jgi:hypothetical protein
MDEIEDCVLAFELAETVTERIHYACRGANLATEMLHIRGPISTTRDFRSRPHLIAFLESARAELGTFFGEMGSGNFGYQD